MEAVAMETDLEIGQTSAKGALSAGYILSTIAVLFLLMDAIMKLFSPDFVVAKNAELGYDASVIVPLGVLLLACTLLYTLPRTAVLGAVLLTGYLGGAVATHVRVGGPAFSVIFPVIVGFFVWGGLYLRDARLAELLPFRSR